jgi:hypothetical protein
MRVSKTVLVDDINVSCGAVTVLHHSVVYQRSSFQTRKDVRTAIQNSTDSSLALYLTQEIGVPLHLLGGGPGRILLVACSSSSSSRSSSSSKPTKCPMHRSS